MPFFRKKREADGSGGVGEAAGAAPPDGGKSGGAPPGDGKGGSKDFQPQPEKARKWFEHARAANDTTNYDYALSCYANGIRLDPEAMSAHEAMYEAAIRHATSGGKPASGREVRSLDDGTPIGKFASAEYAWMKEINNGKLAIRALEAAMKAEQREWANWIARRALALIRRGRKLSKADLLHLRDLFAQCGAWNEAITAGELALQLDPADGELAAEIKNLSAQRAMDQGGYEEAAGQEGGFRKYVKDLDKQRALEEAESLAGARSVDERNLLRAKKAYEDNPRLPDAINRYAQFVKKLETPEALARTHEIYSKGYEETGEYRFRMAAGDIRIEQARAKVKAAVERIQSNGESAGLTAELEKARAEVSALEASEYRERVEKYPTDRTMRYHLGKVELDLGNVDAAMACFQKAKDEPKLRARAGHRLGQCFAREGWYNDAVLEFEEALRALDPGDDQREQAVRYDLMLSKIAVARAERSADLAREARDICSAIARKDIGYRDIRERRREIEELIKDLG